MQVPRRVPAPRQNTKSCLPNAKNPHTRTRSLARLEGEQTLRPFPPDPNNRISQVRLRSHGHLVVQSMRIFSYAFCSAGTPRTRSDCNSARISYLCIALRISAIGHNPATSSGSRPSTSRSKLPIRRQVHVAHLHVPRSILLHHAHKPLNLLPLRLALRPLAVGVLFGQALMHLI